MAPIQSLDGLRGIAAGLVILEHFRYVGLGEPVSTPVGDYGVLLFFILSGFLMGYLYLGTPLDRRALVTYAAARISRIVPLYYFTIITSYILTHFLGSDFIYALSSRELARLLFFIGHAYVFWSIAPEVQFYFVFAFLWWAHARGWFAHASTAIPLAVLGGLLAVVQPLVPGVFVASKLPLFMAGIVVALARRQLQDEVRSPTFTRWIGTAQLIALVVLALLPLHALPDLVPSQPVSRIKDATHNGIYGDYRYIFLIGAALFAFTVETPLSRRVLANRPLRLLGQYSFSIYLLHEPVMHVVHQLIGPLALPYTLQVALALAAVALVGVTSFYLLERPSQTWLRRFLLGLWLPKPASITGSR